jgi:hypothetical protein
MMMPTEYGIYVIDDEKNNFTFKIDDEYLEEGRR